MVGGKALELLQHYDGRARVVGGGTDLLVEIRRGLRRPFEAMVDVSGIAGLGRIIQTQDYMLIGCGVTHATIIRDESIIRHGTCLAESCGVIGGPQVRNAGTLAGNVAHALPAGDGTIGLLALGGEVEITGTTGSRWITAKDTFLGPGKSVIDRQGEVLTRLRFKPTWRSRRLRLSPLRDAGRRACACRSFPWRRASADGATINGRKHHGTGRTVPSPPVAEALVGGTTSTRSMTKPSMSLSTT